MNHEETGFTLIEVAVAMVIMGLIVGSGILMGRSLIDSGHAKEIVAMATDLNIAVKQFKERYHYFPGDLPNANNDIGAIATTSECNYSPTQNTNAGNGRIETAAITNKSTEVDCVANHLYSAGFIKGGTASMRSRFGTVSVVATSDSHFSTANLTGNPTHIIEFADLPLDIARDVDRTLDDGNISQGRMRGINADGSAIDLNTQDSVPFYAVPL
ncbi:MAG: prepilin-type N-terminal cleavage/methylation domain-containing protein [Magnetococcales bacterium]|nr:prepilin-type N-terminal cleavage/methylation domain-containing protein [Magnetococcales bacterium]